MRKLALLAVPFTIAVLGVAPAQAHNAGFVITGDGTCQEVGSDKSGPDVPEQNPNRNTLGPASDLGNLDLNPATPGDQYGARFAADQGNSAVQPPVSKTQTCP
jgi:hypothetical protein